jgi:hypothetical protein
MNYLTFQKNILDCVAKFQPIGPAANLATEFDPMIKPAQRLFRWRA